MWGNERIIGGVILAECFLVDVDLTLPATIIFYIAVGVSVILFCCGIIKLIVYARYDNDEDRVEAGFYIGYAVALGLILWLIVKFVYSEHGTTCGGKIPCGPAMPPPVPPPPLR